MNKTLKKVEEFHRVFDAPVLDSPKIPSKNRCQLRVDLISEELDELSKAILDENIIEIADALCDLQYVLNGAILEFGMKDIFQDLFDEVHNSNMSKTCDTEKQASETVKIYTEKGIETYYQVASNDVEGFKKYNIYRKSDDKILKNKDYKPADFSKILNQF